MSSNSYPDSIMIHHLKLNWKSLFRTRKVFEGVNSHVMASKIRFWSTQFLFKIYDARVQIRFCFTFQKFEFPSRMNFFNHFLGQKRDSRVPNLLIIKFSPKIHHNVLMFFFNVSHWKRSNIKVLKLFFWINSILIYNFFLFSSNQKWPKHLWPFLQKPFLINLMGSYILFQYLLNCTLFQNII